MALLKPTSPRRREVRRSLPRRRIPLPPWLDRRTVAWALLFTLIVAGLGWAIAPRVEAPPRYRLGQVVRQAVVPRVEFTAVDADATARQREAARDRKPAVYRSNTAFLQQIRDGLDELLKTGATYEDVVQIPESTREMLLIDKAALARLKLINGDPELKAQWAEKVERFVESIASIALLTDSRKEIELDSAARTIELHHLTLGKLPPRAITLVYGTGDSAPFRAQVTTYARTASFPGAIQRSVIAVVTDVGDLQPTYLWDKEKTTEARQTAFESAKVVETTYGPDQVLIAAGRKLDKTDIELIHTEHAEYLGALSAEQLWQSRGGRFGLMLVIGAALWVYILAFNRTVSRNPLRGLALTALILLCQAVAVYTTGYKPEFLFAFATFPTLLVAVVLAISYDQRFALAVGALHTLLVAVSLDLTVRFAIVPLVGVATGVALLTEVRTRSKLVIVGGWMGLVMAATALLAGMTGRMVTFADGMPHFTTNALVALISGIALGIFVQGILPGVEHLFKVTTAMKLKELNDVSRPLLHRLVDESPGTYQHSLRIADIAEAAGDAIGANGLLCRVGAMYHDVGKIHKPRYFVENQGGGPNRHDKLSPAMSLLIIVGHVKDGMELAREYGLPPVVRHFIESHHGTTLVEYFYHAARQQQKGDANEKEPAEFTFRYPGPKPQTKEAAILMLCDGVEGAARALTEKTPVRLEQLVHTMANKRLMDGQFDECSITLQDLHKIEVAITKTLCAIYHSRIQYPAGEEPAATEPKETVAG